MELFNMIKVQTEADDYYLNRFNLRLHNKEMDGGEHVLCSPQLMEKKLNDAYEDEVNA